MTDNDGVLRNISWRDVFPWCIIFRTFGLAVSPAVLSLALIGALLTPVGWYASSKLFMPQDAPPSTGNVQLDKLQADQHKSYVGIVAANTKCPCHLNAARSDVPGLTGYSPFSSDLHQVWYQRFVQPFAMLYDSSLSLSWFCCFLFGGLWTLLVWAFFGAAITRIAVMQLGRDERVSFRDAVGHAAKKYLAYVAGPLLLLIAVAAIGFPAAVLGLFMSIDLGVALAGLLWFFVLIASFAMAVVLLGLMFGWPLMWATISAEGTDAFDGLSRSFAYTFQRPLHYLFYGAVVCFFGGLCWFLVNWFAGEVVELSYWSTSWGTYWGDDTEQGSRRIDNIREAVTTPRSANADANDTARVTMFGPSLIYMFESVVGAIATAFSYSFLWCSAAAVYLLLRRDVDQTEFDEVWIEEEDEAYGLPPIKPDKAGVPDLADKPKGGPEKESSPSDAVHAEKSGADAQTSGQPDSPDSQDASSDGQQGGQSHGDQD